jgi:hypothetical protein
VRRAVPSPQKPVVADLGEAAGQNVLHEPRDVLLRRKRRGLLPSAVAVVPPGEHHLSAVGAQDAPVGDRDAVRVLFRPGWNWTRISVTLDTRFGQSGHAFR